MVASAVCDKNELKNFFIEYKLKKKTRLSLYNLCFFFLNFPENIGKLEKNQEIFWITKYFGIPKRYMCRIRMNLNKTKFYQHKERSYEKQRN